MNINPEQKVRVYDRGESILMVQGSYEKEITKHIALKDCTWGSDYVEGYVYWCTAVSIHMSKEDGIESRNYGKIIIESSDFGNQKESAFAAADIDYHSKKPQFWISRPR
tara:strand:+ start:246 stop:572 length:327 start_codon:yes stop_codon:yes gene_type:complete